MNEVLLKALTARIKAEQMTVEQVPEPYQAEVQALLDGDVS